MKKNKGMSLIEASLAILLITLLFIFGRSIYTSVEDYKRYMIASTQIMNLLNNVSSFISRLSDINNLTFTSDKCIAVLDNKFLQANDIIGKDDPNKTVMSQELNVYVKIPECKSEGFNTKKFDYELLVTAKGNLSQYSSSVISSMMNIVGGVKFGDEKNYVGLFRRNIVDLSDWDVASEKIGLIGYEYHHQDEKKGIRINDVSLIPFEEGKPIAVSKKTWVPNYNDKLIVIWAGVNTYQATITFTIKEGDNELHHQSVQVLTDSAKNKFIFHFPQNWLQDLKTNALYNLEIKIQGYGANGSDANREKSTYVLQTISLQLKNKHP